jgi:hypothetical protein
VAKARIIRTAEFPSTTPGRLGRIDIGVFYADPDGNTHGLFVPKETFDPAKVPDLVREDLKLYTSLAVLEIDV